MKRLAVLLLTLLPALWASDILPSTPNGQLVRQYLDAFNGGEAAMRAFLEKCPTATPIDERLARYRHMKADLVSLTPVRLVAEDAGSVQLIVRNAAGEELSLTVMIASDKPQITGLQIVPAGDGSPPQPSGPPEDESKVLREVQDLAAQKAKAGMFSGTALVARGSDVVWQGAYGFANSETHISNQADTRFDVGSIAKSFTRVAIGQLLEQDKLKLTDKVGPFCPPIPILQFASRSRLSSCSTCVPESATSSEKNFGRRQKTRSVHSPTICHSSPQNLCSFRRALRRNIPTADTSCSA